MSDNEMRIVIAEKCGLDTTKHQVGGVFCYYDKKRHMQAALPNYPNDLNAMAEARKTLNDVQRRKYAMELHAITNAGHSFGRPENYWVVCDATAHQHAEAFIKTICPEKWKGDV